MPIPGFDMALMLAELKADEGVRLVVYDDATGRTIGPGSAVIGHPTIGVGRALDVTGISPVEASTMLLSDVSTYLVELRKLPWFVAMDATRQRSIVNMRHQLGLRGLMRFRAMIDRIENGSWQAAAAEGLDSEWARQSPVRAERVMAQLATGVAT